MKHEKGPFIGSKSDSNCCQQANISALPGYPTKACWKDPSHYTDHMLPVYYHYHVDVPLHSGITQSTLDTFSHAGISLPREVFALRGFNGPTRPIGMTHSTTRSYGRGL